MKLKTRIMVLTVGGLIGVLVFFSLLIYVFCVRLTTDAEIRLLWNRAQIALRNPEIRKEENWANPDLLTEFLTDHTMIRIIAPSGEVKVVASNDKGLVKLRPVYRTYYHTRIITSGTVRRIYIQVPVLKLPEKEQIGVLEVAKTIHLTAGHLRILLATLALGTLIGTLFAVGAGIFYVRWIYRPVEVLAGTMEAIERSGAFGRLEGEFATGYDEFGRLGITFNRMMSRLEENYKRQRHFVEDASHELRTPLTVIQSYAGMLKRWGGSDPLLREEAVAAIEQEAERLKQLVEGLLETADGGRGLPQPEFASLDLLQLARITASQLSSTLKRSIVVHPAGTKDSHPSERGEEAPEKDFQLAGNREKLKQLLIILLDNAIKFSELPVELVLDRDTAAGEIILTVKDKGIGIPREHISRLFDRFYRVDQARTRQTGGSGLGLAIAKRIVEEHGGAIFVTSEPEAGTVVTVRLPAQR